RFSFPYASGGRKLRLMIATSLAAAARGFALSASLIVAIGAQNAFLLRQGLKRARGLPLVLVFALPDALLISGGGAGAGALVAAAPRLLVAVRWAGGAYLAWFALSALRRAFAHKAAGLSAARGGEPTSLEATLLTALALTYLNPHVYLDTVVMLGSIGARETGGARVAFVGGAIAASGSWFFGLGYGARLPAPPFPRP